MITTNENRTDRTIVDLVDFSMIHPFKTSKLALCILNFPVIMCALYRGSAGGASFLLGLLVCVLFFPFSAGQGGDCKYQQ